MQIHCPGCFGPLLQVCYQGDLVKHPLRTYSALAVTFASGRRLLAVCRESPTLRLCRHDVLATGSDLPALCRRVPGIGRAPVGRNAIKGCRAVKTRARQVRTHSSSPNQFAQGGTNMGNVHVLSIAAAVVPQTSSTRPGRHLRSAGCRPGKLASLG